MLSSPRRFSTLFFLLFVFGFVAMANKCHALVVPALPLEPSPIRYELSYGPDPTKPDHTIDLGVETEYILTGLLPETTYYVGITAIHGESGRRSQVSALVIYTTPPMESEIVRPPPEVVYEVQTSADLNNWTTRFYVPGSGDVPPKLFLRLIPRELKREDP